MSRFAFFPAMTLMTITLAGCSEGVTPYKQSADTVIATNVDEGPDKVGLHPGNAAIAYDPDGCQAWIMDDGVEGYAGRRFDPITGLPVCDSLYPPGTVVGNYQTDTTGMKDWVPSRHN